MDDALAEERENSAFSASCAFLLWQELLLLSSSAPPHSQESLARTPFAITSVATENAPLIASRSASILLAPFQQIYGKSTRNTNAPKLTTSVITVALSA